MISYVGARLAMCLAFIREIQGVMSYEGAGRLAFTPNIRFVKLARNSERRVKFRLRIRSEAEGNHQTD